MHNKKNLAKPVRDKRDDRVEKSKNAVLKTTHNLLKKSGLAGVSIDEVARQSGIAKTTIYRHWPSRESLLLDACSQLSSRPQVPDMGTLHDDLEVLATGIAKRLQEPWSSVLPSIIDAAERDKKLAELHAQIHGQMRGALLTVIERGRRRGELPRSEDALELVASIFGPLFYRRFLSREPLDEAFARKVVERALRKGD